MSTGFGHLNEANRGRRRRSWYRRAGLLTLPLALASAGCAGASAGGAGGAGGAGPAPGAAPAAGPAYTQADVDFMQGMIAHHRQAQEMAALVPTRTSTESIHLLAERIEVSQTDEIAMMARWLEERGAAVPAPGSHAHHAGHGAAMPGMLSPEQMSALAAAQGAAFDRLFLEGMIQHHQGALVMVGKLLVTPGAGQEVDVYRIASEIDSDQRIEIERMERMLEALG